MPYPVPGPQALMSDEQERLDPAWGLRQQYAKLAQARALKAMDAGADPQDIQLKGLQIEPVTANYPTLAEEIAAKGGAAPRDPFHNPADLLPSGVMTDEDRKYYSNPSVLDDARQYYSNASVLDALGLGNTDGAQEMAERGASDGQTYAQMVQGGGAEAGGMDWSTGVPLPASPGGAPPPEVAGPPAAPGAPPAPPGQPPQPGAGGGSGLPEDFWNRGLLEQWEYIDTLPPRQARDVLAQMYMRRMLTEKEDKIPPVKFTFLEGLAMALNPHLTQVMMRKKMQPYLDRQAEERRNRQSWEIMMGMINDKQQGRGKDYIQGNKHINIGPDGKVNVYDIPGVPAPIEHVPGHPGAIIGRDPKGNPFIDMMPGAENLPKRGGLDRTRHTFSKSTFDTFLDHGLDPYTYYDKATDTFDVERGHKALIAAIFAKDKARVEEAAKKIGLAARQKSLQQRRSKKMSGTVKEEDYKRADLEGELAKVKYLNEMLLSTLKSQGLDQDILDETKRKLDRDEARIRSELKKME